MATNSYTLFICEGTSITGTPWDLCENVYLAAEEAAAEAVTIIQDGIRISGDYYSLGAPISWHVKDAAGNVVTQDTYYVSLDDVNATSHDVRDWDWVVEYVSDNDNGPSEAYDVTLYTGVYRGVWFVKEHLDGAGSHYHGPYESESAARDACDALETENAVGEPGESAQEYMLRMLDAEATEGEDPEGEYCVYWETVLADSHVVARYSTLSAAVAATTAATIKLRANFPGGGLRCHYSTRTLVDGEWIEESSY